MWKNKDMRERPHKEGYMFCKNCGTQLSDDAKFCENCGTASAAVTPPVQPAPPEQRKPAAAKNMRALRKAVQITGAVVAVAVIVIVVIIFNVNNSSNQTPELGAEQAQPPFYAMASVYQFDVDFVGRGVLHYRGYRPGREEFLTAVDINGGYFQYQLDSPETLIPSSYRHLQNNPALDTRIRNFMRNNNLTCCETFYANDYGGFTYIVNYSFDNHKTFGYVAMDSTEHR